MKNLHNNPLAFKFGIPTPEIVTKAQQGVEHYASLIWKKEIKLLL